MKHVGTGARSRQIILVTGFGAFPGTRRNPTLGVLARLERQTARLARLGIELRCATLPVVYDSIEPAMRAAIGNCRPDAILHLGLAARRRAITIETRAMNRAAPLHPDAARRRPAQVLVQGGAPVLRATIPAARLRAALAQAGHDARLSIDAGGYVCNATFYRSLAGGLAPCIGFIHVPKIHVPQACGGMPGTACRPSVETLSRAVLAAVLVMCRGTRGAAD